MMDVVSQLMIAALFSLHQYMPADSVGIKYFEYAEDPVTLQTHHTGIDIMTAAHESCRSLLKKAGGAAELDRTEAELFAMAAGQLEKNEQNLIESGSSPIKASEVMHKVCDENFDAQAFSPSELSDIETFVNDKIAVLTKADLESTGNFPFFGGITLYDRNHKALGPLFSLTEHWVPFNEISPNMVKAVLAIEDQYFYKHDGVYLGSLMRMAYKMQSDKGEDASSEGTNFSNVSGGSTITMQLLKNLYFLSWPEDQNSVFTEKAKLKTVLRKVREWYWAKPFEKYHEKLGPGSGKRFVLENYLNLVDYGPGVRGIDQASHVFFKKSPLDLDLAEAAFMATLFKNPSRYSRPANYEDTTKRRATVLKSMSELNQAAQNLKPITLAQAEEAGKVPLPLWTIPNNDNANAVDAYIRNYAQDFIKTDVTLPEGMRSIESELVSTIDSDLQKVVFETVRTHLDKIDSAKGRLALKKVGPARDDRSRVAVAGVEDVRSEAQAELTELQTKFKEMQVNVQLAVYLGDSGNKADGSQKSFYLVQKTDSEVALPQELQTELQNALSANAQFVGQVLVAEMDPARCTGLQVTESYKNLQFILSQYPAVSETPTTPTEEVIPETVLPLGSTEVAVENTPSLEAFPVPFKVSDSGEMPPLPRPRPKNADQLIAESQARETERLAKLEETKRLNRFTLLPIGLRPNVKIPYSAPTAAACVHIVNGSELQRLQIDSTFYKKEDTVSKKIVRAFLRRMELMAPREEMYPALYDGRGGEDSPVVLIPGQEPEDSESEYSQWVRPVKLASKFNGENHAGFLNQNIRSREFRVGQVFWVTGVDEEKTVFALASPKIQAAVVVMDSRSGDVLANFGGYLPKTSKFFDRSRIALRSPGSTLKPWLYYLALTKGFQPDSTLKGADVVFKMPGRPDYKPLNFDGTVGAASESLETAMIQSHNKATVGLVVDPRFGPDQVANLYEWVDLLEAAHVYSPVPDDEVQGTMLIGTRELQMIDLVSSFTFFANGQNIAQPRFFKSLVTGQGNTLFQGQESFLPVPHSEDRVAVFQIQNLLMKVANSGTAGALSNFATGTLGLKQCGGRDLGMNQICFGGKTGTSSDAKDNWFMGVAKNFVIGVWVGYDLPESTGETGGKLSLPIFMDIVQKGQDHLPAIEPIVTGADIPEGLYAVNVGNGGTCRTTDGSGSVIFSSNNGADLPVCRQCSCDAYTNTDFFGTSEVDYMINIEGTYYGSWNSYDTDGSQDLKDCRAYARIQGCQE